MNVLEQLAAELRAKYSAEQIKEMAKDGRAMPDGSYPIDDVDDLKKAIKAVGRGKSNSHASIRRHIMARAKALGHSDLIPDSWNADGTLKEAKSGAPAVEHRSVPIGADALATGGADQRERFHGHAAVFDQWTTIGRAPWGFREKIAPGAFSKTITESDQVMLDSHEAARPLARRSAGTLRLSEDGVGLAVDADVPDTTIGRDFAENVRNGNIRGMSFGFQVVKDEWTQGQEGEMDERVIREARLFEVSGTAFPAYDGTDAGMRTALLARSTRARRADADTDTDDDPSTLAAQVDAALDQAMALVADVDLESLPADVAQAIQLVGSASNQIDQLLDVMGVYDPDDSSDDDDDRTTGDDDAGRSRHEPAGATRGSSTTEPARSTRTVEHMAMRRKALAARYGLPA